MVKKGKQRVVTNKMVFKKGDKVKVVVFDRYYGGRIPEENRNDIFEVIRKYTQALRRYQRSFARHSYIKIKTTFPADEYGRTERIIDIPIEHVIKINTKMYDFRDKLVEAEDENEETKDETNGI